MYLRHTTARKNGKTRSYWRLVRSVRRGRRVVQETVAQLGELDGQGRARAGALALRITGREEQYELFEAPPDNGARQLRLRVSRLGAERPFSKAVLMQGGGEVAEFFVLTAEQMRDRMLESQAIDEAKLDRALALLADPAFWAFGGDEIAVWGRKAA
jgi:hypothetical protein